MTPDVVRRESRPSKPYDSKTPYCWGHETFNLTGRRSWQCIWGPFAVPTYRQEEEVSFIGEFLFNWQRIAVPYTFPGRHIVLLLVFVDIEWFESNGLHETRPNLRYVWTVSSRHGISGKRRTGYLHTMLTDELSKRNHGSISANSHGLHLSICNLEPRHVSGSVWNTMLFSRPRKLTSHTTDHLSPRFTAYAVLFGFITIMCLSRSHLVGDKRSKNTWDVEKCWLFVDIAVMSLGLSLVSSKVGIFITFTVRLSSDACQLFLRLYVMSNDTADQVIICFLKFFINHLELHRSVCMRIATLVSGLLLHDHIERWALSPQPRLWLRFAQVLTFRSFIVSGTSVARRILGIVFLLSNSFFLTILYLDMCSPRSISQDSQSKVNCGSKVDIRLSFPIVSASI